MLFYSVILRTEIDLRMRPLFPRDGGSIGTRCAVPTSVHPNLHYFTRRSRRGSMILVVWGNNHKFMGCLGPYSCSKDWFPNLGPHFVCSFYREDFLAKMWTTHPHTHLTYTLTNANTHLTKAHTHNCTHTPYKLTTAHIPLTNSQLHTHTPYIHTHSLLHTHAHTICTCRLIQFEDKKYNPYCCKAHYHAGKHTSQVLKVSFRRRAKVPKTHWCWSTVPPVERCQIAPYRIALGWSYHEGAIWKRHTGICIA